MSGPAPSPRAGRLLAGVGLALLATAVWGETLPVTRFTTRDGLAANRIKRIVSDPSGFLWFCTASGLSRYDGHSYASYGEADGLPDLSINDLLVDADGSYWVATNGGGVAAFRPRATRGPLFVPLVLRDRAPGSRRVNVLHQAADGRIWAGTDAGLFSWHPGRGEDALRRESLAPDAGADRRLPVWSLAEGPGARLWVGTSRGLYKLAPDGERTHVRVGASESSDTVRAVLVDRDRRLWVGHEDGLIVLAPDPEEGVGAPVPPLLESAVPCAPPGRPSTAELSLPRAPGGICHWHAPESSGLTDVWTLYEARDGGLWVGTATGLFRFAADSVTSYGDTVSLPRRSLRTVTEDAGGNLWVGTSYYGAFQLVLDGFVTYGAADGLENPVAPSVFTGPGGELYVVTGGGLVHRLEEDRLVAVEPNLPDQGPDGGRVGTQYAVQDRHGDWWFPTRRGLFRFPVVSRLEDLARREPLGPFTRRHGLAGDGARYAFPDSRGDLWVTTRFPGREVLTRWERETGTFHRYSDRHGLPPYNPVVSFLEHPRGILWFGFWEGGLARYRDGRFELFGAGDGLPDGAVAALTADEAGGIWVGADGGLARLEDAEVPHPRFSRPAAAEDLRQVTALVTDLQGRLYAGTTGGVFRLERADGRLEHFTVDDGLPGDWVKAAFRDEAGDLWFGTTAGLARLSPGPPIPRRPPAPRIEGLTVDGVPWPLPELGAVTAGPFELPGRPTRIRIDFGALAFHPGEVLQYRYRLGGAGSDWVPAGSEGSVLLGNLGAGHYRFEVEATGRRGRVSPEPATLTFTVPAPFWQRGWFLALVAVLLGAALAGAHRLRVRRLLEVQRVRDRIAADLHDELGSSLTRISILSEVARRRASNEAAGVLEEMGETARSLLESTRDLVWAIDPRHEELTDLVVRLRAFASDVLDGRGVRWELTTSGPLSATGLTPEQRRHLLLFYKEALHNAVRHSGAGRVEIHLEVSDGRLLGEVADDGSGVEAAALEAAPPDGSGRGLASLRYRADALDGRLEIDSAPGAGTRVRLEMPLR